MWRARKAGLTPDDLRNMTPAELDFWLELHEWVNDTGDDDAPQQPDAERAFFHM